MASLTPKQSLWASIVAAVGGRFGVLLLGWSFHLLYKAPSSCAVDASCAEPGSVLRQRRILGFVCALLAVPRLAPKLGLSRWCRAPSMRATA